MEHDIEVVSGDGHARRRDQTRLLLPFRALRLSGCDGSLRVRGPLLGRHAAPAGLAADLAAETPESDSSRVLALRHDRSV